MNVKTNMMDYKNRVLNKSIEERKDTFNTFVEKLSKRENNDELMTKALNKLRGK